MVTKPLNYNVDTKKNIDIQKLILIYKSSNLNNYLFLFELGYNYISDSNDVQDHNDNNIIA